MPVCSPTANADDALGLTTIADEVMADRRRAGMAVMRLSGLALPMGTKVWRRRFRADPNAVSQ
jgi:hypothetical protein